VTVRRAVRLPAAERRQALVDSAICVFARKSYAGATTAEIAREAGVSEPILYRHFDSKRDLYLACIDAVWERLRLAVEAAIEKEEDPAEWPMAVPRAVQALRQRRVLPAHFWIQALSDAGGDPKVRRHMRAHLEEVHEFFADVIRRAQLAGGVPADRDADAEAWINVGIGLLRSVEDRVGGLLAPPQMQAIAASRRRWLTGRA
jgi:AcrR family transcriptional regulator